MSATGSLLFVKVHTVTYLGFNNLGKNKQYILETPPSIQSELRNKKASHLFELALAVKVKLQYIPQNIPGGR